MSHFNFLHCNSSLRQLLTDNDICWMLYLLLCLSLRLVKVILRLWKMIGSWIGRHCARFILKNTGQLLHSLTYRLNTVFTTINKKSPGRVGFGLAAGDNDAWPGPEPWSTVDTGHHTLTAAQMYNWLCDTGVVRVRGDREIMITVLCLTTNNVPVSQKRICPMLWSRFWMFYTVTRKLLLYKVLLQSWSQ